MVDTVTITFMLLIIEPMLILGLLIAVTVTGGWGIMLIPGIEITTPVPVE